MHLNPALAGTGCLLASQYKPAKDSDMSAFKVNRVRVQKAFLTPSRAKQAFKDECNINNIMARYEKTGLIDHIKENQGRYVDAPSHEDFHQAMNLVTSAKSMFESLPSKIRSDFKNDPSLFLDFVADESNREQMVKYGLVDPSNLAERAAEAPSSNPAAPVEEKPADAPEAS